MRFGELSIAFDDQVLRPREWTTAQSEWAAVLAAASPAGPLLELCAGVGQIGLLAVAREPRDLVMVDANPRACELARRNVDEARLASRGDIRNARLEEALGPRERFVGVIADPPWVPHNDVGRYPEDPTTAIDGGPEGLDVARACIEVAAGHLEPRGWLLLQLGSSHQANTLAGWAKPLGVHLLEIREYERGVLVHLVKS